MRRWVLPIVLIALAGSAAATPERQVHVSDAPFALSADHLFVLRRSRDNLGLHTASVEQVELVALSLRDGTQEVWPVHAQTVRIDFDPATRRSYRVVETEEQAGRVDPYAYVMTRGAGLLEPVMAPQGEEKPLAHDAQGALRRSLDALAAREFPGSAAGSATGAGAGTDGGATYRTLDRDADRCVERDEGHPVALSQARVQLVRVTCYLWFDEVGAAFLMPRLVAD